MSHYAQRLHDKRGVSSCSSKVLIQCIGNWFLAVNIITFEAEFGTYTLQSSIYLLDSVLLMYEPFMGSIHIYDSLVLSLTFQIAMIHPLAVTNSNIDMESLISDQNRSMAYAH
jgi:hypothetical protein